MPLDLSLPVLAIEEIDSLDPYPGNPNEGDVGEISLAIQRNGWYGHIVAQKSRRRILVGHHRLQAARQLGAQQIPVEWLDVDDATARRIMLADNRTTRLGRDDDALLEAQLAAARNDEGLVGTGFDDDDYDKLVRDLSAPLKIEPEDDNEPVKHVCPECGHQWAGKPS